MKNEKCKMKNEEQRNEKGKKEISNINLVLLFNSSFNLPHY